MSANRVKECSLLLIDDEEANLDLLEGLLLIEGYTRLTRVADARRAVGAFEQSRPDLVLLDLHMPFVTGYEVLEEIRKRTDADDYLPVLVLTADVTTQARERALSKGAQDFLTKPFDAVEVLLRVRNLLETRLLQQSQRKARQAAEDAERRARLLAEASRVLATSLDTQTGLAQVARLLAPSLASFAAFVMRDDEALRWTVAAGEGDASIEAALADPESSLRVAIDGGAGGPVQVNGTSVLVAPLRSGAGSIGALLVGGVSCEDDATTIRDLADRTALALENARLFAEAQAASQARERMLSVVAHDLRNPLAVISMYSEMLLDLLPGDSENAGDDYTAEALTSIYKSSHRMQEEIESLLDISRLQQGTFVVTPDNCRLTDLFDDAESLLRPLAAAREIQFELQPPPGEDEHVASLDSGRVQQVLSNLVGNALKFTPAGGKVVLCWEVVGGQLRVSVRDTGPGIPADQLPHIFSAFWQASKGDRRGLGLGLWISRAIIDGHGGRIWVDSTEGCGASFHFSIPIQAVPHEEADEGRDEPEIGRLTHEPAPLAS